MNRYYRKKKMINKSHLRDYGFLISISILFVTLCVQIWQTNISNKQTDINTEEFIASYRPIGVVHSDSTIVVSLNDSSVVFDHGVQLTNNGSGVLTFWGALNYVSKDSDGIKDFRNKLFSSKLDISQLNFDTVYEALRGTPVFQEKSHSLKLRYGPINYFNTGYIYLYSIYFYSDHQGKLLYDTISMHQISTEFLHDDLNIVALGVEQYHIYTDNDIKQLVRALSNKDDTHNLINVLESF